MNQVAYYGNLCRNRERLHQQLGNLFAIDFKPLESALEARLGQFTVFDFDLNDTTHLLTLKDKLKDRPKDAKVVFVTEKASRLQDTRALAIGATDIIHRPVEGRTLLAKLWGEVRSLADERPEFAENSGPGVAAAADTLRAIFSAACTGAAPDQKAIQSAGDAVVGQVEEQGLAAWIATVRALANRGDAELVHHQLVVLLGGELEGRRIGGDRGGGHAENSGNQKNSTHHNPLLYPSTAGRVWKLE